MASTSFTVIYKVKHDGFVFSFVRSGIMGIGRVTAGVLLVLLFSPLLAVKLEYYNEDEAPSSFLFAVHAPSEEASTIHYISSNLLSITKDLISVSPRNRQYRNASTAERLAALQTLQPSAIAELASGRGVHLPQQANAVCQTASLYYRTMDGSCNNLKFTCWGRRDEPYRRWLPPVYDDGLNEPRRHAKDGTLLPSPRLVYNHVSAPMESGPSTSYRSVSSVSVVWGQAIAHDILFTPAVVSKEWDHTLNQFKNAKPECCKGQISEDCFPIKMDYPDAFFPMGHCMSIVRSQAYVYSPFSCSPLKLGVPREQMNQLTPFLDASLVYGTSEEEARILRAHGGTSAELRMDHSLGFSYLPRLNSTEQVCKVSVHGCDDRCFHAGEKRSNENPSLGALHSLFAREHNRITRYMPGGRHWMADTLFHVARKIIGAIMQHITYNEYLPIVLGPSLMHAMNLRVPSNSYKYQETINPALYNAFVTAAYRYGHSMVSGRSVRLGRSYDDSPRLSSDFFGMDDFCNPHGDMLTALLGGQISQKAQKVDCIFSKQLTQHLFAMNADGPGMDLFSMNVQRGRDHGIPPYVRWREACHLPAIHDYNDLRAIMPGYVVDGFAKVYGPGHVDEVDLYVAGVSEYPVNDGVLGPTFTCIVANQFRNLKFGDRFWYENLDHPGAFTQAQVQSIQRTTLSGLLCRTTDIREIQRHAFFVESPHNPKVPCDVIIKETDLDLRLWA